MPICSGGSGGGSTTSSRCRRRPRRTRHGHRDHGGSRRDPRAPALPNGRPQSVARAVDPQERNAMPFKDAGRRVMWVAVLLLAASALLSVRAADSGVRAVVPSEMTWTPVPGYPPGYARALLEGETDKA